MLKSAYIDIKETIVTHQLNNGLRIAIIEKKGFKTSSFFFALPYGSNDVFQEDILQKYQNSLGIAHFLEHKLFENNNGVDIMEAFSKLNASVNAFTSHNETVYTFSSVKNISKGLNLLLDFVQHFDISEEAVEKEKGIIVQELNMYYQMPEQRLIFETYQSLYHNHPVRNDIGGNEESVNQITLSELFSVYERNYHPQNSLLVCVSSLSAAKLIKIIETNQSLKNFPSKPLVLQSPVDEPDDVKRNFYEFSMDIQASKLTYAFKLNQMSSDNRVNLKNEWILRMACELVFSSISNHYQQWIDQDRIHDYFGFEVELNSGFGFVLFYGESENTDDFKALIHEGLQTNLEDYEDDFNALKKRYKAMLIRSLNEQDDCAVSYIRSQFSNIPFEYQFDVLDLIRFDDLKSAFRTLNDMPSSLIFMKKK